MGRAVPEDGEPWTEASAKADEDGRDRIADQGEPDEGGPVVHEERVPEEAGYGYGV